MRLETIRVNDVVESTPAAVISVMSPAGTRGTKCLARLDTGTDVTCVPLSCVTGLFLPFNVHVALRMADGGAFWACSRKGAIEIWDGETPFGLFDARTGIVVMADMEYALLGMDVLRHLKIEGYGRDWNLEFPGG